MSRPEPLAISDAVGLPQEAAFAEPWQAEAFALVVALVERNVFTWAQWAAALSREVRSPSAAADGHDYYERWLKALETLLSANGMAPAAAVDRLAAAWQRAAHATPHGQPIHLANDPELASHAISIA